MEERNIHELIETIDNELLILSQAKEAGSYMWFDFKRALKQLSGLFDELGYNDYRKCIAAQYIHIFNDLCRTVVEQEYVRHLSYDKDSHIIKDEYTVTDMVAHTRSIIEKEREVEEDYMQHVYENNTYPESNCRLLIETVKIDYLLRGCEIDYLRFIDIYDADPVIDTVMGKLGFPSNVLNNKDCFDGYFNIDISVKDKHRISFERYIQQIKAASSITEATHARKNPQRVEAAATAQQPAHFDNEMTYEQAQSMLEALQQNGFIATSTTVDTFYYRMTGNGTPTNEQIEWVRLGKRRKRDISKSSLVYFLSKCANYNVDNTRLCQQKIADIFGLELSASTINRVAKCEYRTEIDIIGSILQS